MKKLFIFILPCLLLLSGGCSNSQNTTDKNKLSDGSGINKNVIRMSIPKDFDTSFKQKFEDKSGYKLVFKKFSSENEVIQNANSLVSKPNADVIFGINNYNFVLINNSIGKLTLSSSDLKSNNLKSFESFTPTDTEVYPQNIYTPLTESIYSVTYDANWFSKHNIPPPNTFTDLRNKRYRGLFCIPNPLASNKGAAFLLSTFAYFGPKKYVKFLSDLLNRKTQIASNDATANSLWTKNGGKYPITITSNSKNIIKQSSYRWITYTALLKGQSVNMVGGNILISYLSENYNPAKKQYLLLDNKTLNNNSRQIFKNWTSL